MNTTHTTHHFAPLCIALLALFGTSLQSFASRVGIYCCFSGSNLTTCSDSLLRTSLVITPAGQALIEVENLTDQIIYVNRGNSFAWVNGKSEPMFIPSAQSESHTIVSGTVEHVWHNESRIYGEAHTSGQTVFDRRILPVAPHGQAVVYAWSDLPRLLRNDIIETNYKGQGVMCPKGRFLTFQTTDEQPKNGMIYTLGEKFSKGDFRNYTYNTTPLLLSADIQYSTNDPLLQDYNAVDSQRNNAGKAVKAHVSDYVQDIFVGSYNGVSKQGELLPSMPLVARFRPCFAFRNGKNLSGPLGVAGVVGTLVVAAIALNNNPDPDMGPDWPF